MNSIIVKRIFVGSIALTLTACAEQQRELFIGYVEGDYVRLSSSIGGTLKEVYLKRGDLVNVNSPAFLLEQDSERSAEQEARFRLEQTKAQANNLKTGKRPDEIAATQAQLAQAQAALNLSTANLNRQHKLVNDSFISPAALDEYKAAVARDRGRVNELTAQTKVANMGARPAEISAAQEQVNAAQMQLDQAAWKVAQKTRRTPTAGHVIDVFFRVGEWVPAGSAVVQLLPDENIKARFYVAQAALAKFALGKTVAISCDDCGEPIQATISFISKEVEFTSPIIYSKENRASLVYMLEAKPIDPKNSRLKVGQPIEVKTLAAK